jgi:SAM-dependent methyltransferase
MIEAEIESIYKTVVDEYNVTPLAVRDGWVHRPSRWTLIHMRAIAKYLPPGGILVDIGTGCGIGARFALRLGARVISIDSCEAAGSSALENIRLAGAEGYPCDILRDPLPVETGTADCILFSDVIEHMIHSPKSALLEMKRVLKPGGVCIASTPNATRLTVRLKVLLGYSNWPNLREYFHEKGHWGHHHEYTISDFRFAFEETGFVIESLRLYEENLRGTRILKMKEMENRNRSKVQRESEPLKFRMAKAPLVALTEMLPTLRSSMILIARKSA